MSPKKDAATIENENSKHQSPHATITSDTAAMDYTTTNVDNDCTSRCPRRSTTNSRPETFNGRDTVTDKSRHLCDQIGDAERRERRYFALPPTFLWVCMATLLYACVDNSQEVAARETTVSSSALNAAPPCSNSTDCPAGLCLRTPEGGNCRKLCATDRDCAPEWRSQMNAAHEAQVAYCAPEKSRIPWSRATQQRRRPKQAKDDQ